MKVKKASSNFWQVPSQTNLQRRTSTPSGLKCSAYLARTFEFSPSLATTRS